MRWTLSLFALALTACPSLPEPVDAGPSANDDGGVQPTPDAGADGGADAGFGPVAIERWCESRAFALCARDVRCLRLSPGRFPLCLERARQDCEAAALVGAVSGGRLQYFASAGARCLNAYASGSCSADPPECAGLFLGLVPPDGGCHLADECDANGFCFTYANTCPFRCRPYRALGESCSFYERCRPHEGVCQSSDGGPRTCGAPRGPGQDCTWEECRSDLTCYSNKCVQRQAKEGESCGERGPFPQCEADAFCRQPPPPTGGTAPPGVCQRRAGLGGACSGSGSCLPNLRCSSLYATGVCVPWGDEGATCSGWGECQDELYCLPRSSRCLALPTDGGDCSSKGSSYSCAVGYFCDYSGASQPYLCKPARAAQEPCGYDEACLSRNCEWGPLGDGGSGMRCAPKCAERLDGGA